MDQQFEAVLAAYHERLRTEKQKGKAEWGSTEHSQRLLAVGPDTGQLLNILARNLDKPVILEIGTSFGYSGIWLGDAARASGGRVITLELEQYKADYARDMAEKAGVADYIDFRVGDALELIQNLEVKVDFVLLDLWKHLYVPCLDLFYPRLNPGAIVIADNISRPGGEDALRYCRAVRALPGISSVQLPIGTGIEVSRFLPEG